MGILGKLKDAARFVTGGAAKVRVFPAEKYSNGNEPIKFKIEVDVKDKEINFNYIYLKVKSIEKIQAKDKEDNEYITNTSHEYSDEFKVVAGGTLDAETSATYDIEIQLPTNLNGSYYGTNASHIYYIQAGVDMPGNDPDSGWQEIQVYF